MDFNSLLEIVNSNLLFETVCCNMRKFQTLACSSFFIIHYEEKETEIKNGERERERERKMRIYYYSHSYIRINFIFY